LRNAVFAKVGQRAVRRIALSAFRHIHSLSLRFHLERRTGGLARAVERGIAGIEFLLSFMLFNVVPTLFEIVIVSAILWRLYDWTFAAVTLGTIVTYIAFTFIVTDWRVRFRREMNERNSEANTKSVDSLLKYETDKYFANEEHEAQRYERALIAIEPEIEDRPGAPALAVQRGAVTFRHVDFRYDPRREILRDLDFAMPPGGSVAIVGPSGAGKSTIARLLFRFYDVSAGAIEIDGQDIREVTQDSLRRAIGVVPQDTVLFNDTILHNIAHRRPGASRGHLE